MKMCFTTPTFSPQTKPRCACAAFTLIEMLVVIAVIIVLSALITPSIRSSMDRSRSVQCMANLRDIGVAALAYASDNGGRLPPISSPGMGFGSDIAHRWWMSVLYHYPEPTVEGEAVDSKRVWRCPEVRDEDFFTNNAVTLHSYAPFRPVINYGESYRVYQVVHPERMWMFGDAGSPTETAGPGEPPLRYRTRAVLTRWNHAWEGDIRPAYRHGSRRNPVAHYVAVSGHVTSITWKVGQDLNNGAFGVFVPGRNVVY